MTFVSNYDPSIFRTSIYKASDEVRMPVHNLVNNPIHLTITVKDIDLEGLDSSTPDKAYKIRNRKYRKRQEKLQNSQVVAQSQQKTITRPTTAPPAQLSPRIRKMFGKSVKLIPIYEGTFYQNNFENSIDPKPIGLLSSSQKVQRPQTVIPKAGPRGGPRVNALESSSGSGL
ncbi:hypothetical protein M9Y10_040620 [Tritrichomonas musculus]|uniref:Uncharacterized protein n=1 Tax=Tritrichomonas musculus TaxID=1915356 RepID=A0ABR2GQE4_9EUKA